MSDRSLPHLSLRVPSTRWEEGLLRGLKKSQLGLNSKEMFKRWWAAHNRRVLSALRLEVWYHRGHIGPCEGLSWGGGAGRLAPCPTSQVRKRASSGKGTDPCTGLHPHDLITPKAPAPKAATSGFRVSTYGYGGRKQSVHHMLHSGEGTLQPEWPVSSTHVDGVFENDWK